MKKDNLYTAKRYILIVAIAFCLVILGASLEKSWRMTPETHFQEAMTLLEGSPEKALPHFLISFKSKDPVLKSVSAYHLARLYHKGEKGMTQNIQKAVFYYEQAAQMHMPKAQYELALLYDVGDKIPENRDKAINLMIEAAETLPEAKYALAVWIERGYLGKPNQAWAVALYEQAAHAGIKNAMKSLISIYHGGYGRFPDNIRREQYWRKRLESKKK